MHKFKKGDVLKPKPYIPGFTGTVKSVDRKFYTLTIPNGIVKIKIKIVEENYDKVEQ